MNDIREYSGYFTFSPASDEQIVLIKGLFARNGFEVDLFSTGLEFQSTGRDEDRLVVLIFSEVARILTQAEGELRCEIDDEQIDPRFEFFTIKDSNLLMQQGAIVRENHSIAV